MVKPIIKKIITESLEIVKDSARELGKAVSPGEIMNQLAGTQNPPEKNEMGEYLENVGDPTLTGDKLKQKEAELEAKKQKELEEARNVINPNPAHMRLPPQERKLTPYEQTVKDDEEKKKAKAVETQQQGQSLSIPKSRPKGKLGATSHKATTEGLKKDSKFG